MAKSSPLIKISPVCQVGIVVKDIEKVAQNYWDILGIGPWTIMTPPPHLKERFYHGKPTYYSGKFAFAQLGQLELELLESVQGPNIYDDYLAEHGEGANHLQYKVGSLAELDKHMDIMAKNGIPTLQSHRFGDNGGVAYFDAIKTLKTVWEPIVWADNNLASTIMYPADPKAVSPARVKVKEVFQVSLAVKDLDEAMENYENIFGIGPWKTIEAGPDILKNRTYYGTPARHTFRVGIAMHGSVEFELIQPVSGDTIYADFISRHGEGICHMAFKTNDVSKVSRIMNEEGFPTAQSGNSIDGSAYAYFDTRGPLKILWESFKSAPAGAKSIFNKR